MELQNILAALDQNKAAENANVARLIPHVNLKQNEERLTSIVLASVKIVPEFADVLLASLGQRIGTRSKIDCFVELQLERNAKTNKASERPDGLIVHRTGRSQWICLIEAKSGNDKLDLAQVEKYIKLAERHNGQRSTQKNPVPNIDAFLTITNDFVAVPEHHPLAKDLPKKLKASPDVYHWSWTYILTQAELLLSQDDFTDLTKRAVIKELVEYMESANSGVQQFTQMNDGWRQFIQLSQKREITNKTKDGQELLENCVSAWHQECRDIVLLLSREVRAPVALKLSRAHTKDARKRLDDDIKKVLNEFVLECEIEVPKAASLISIKADTYGRRLALSITLDCNGVRKSPEATLNWFLRQLDIKSEWPLSLICIGPRNKRYPTSFKCSEILKDYSHVVGDKLDFTPERLEFTWEVNMSSDMDKSRKFIERLEDSVRDFYRNVVQNMKSAPPIPPKMQETE